jgi:hypothetical protein
LRSDTSTRSGSGQPRHFTERPSVGAPFPAARAPFPATRAPFPAARARRCRVARQVRGCPGGSTSSTGGSTSRSGGPAMNDKECHSGARLRHHRAVSALSRRFRHTHGREPTSRGHSLSLPASPRAARGLAPARGIATAMGGVSMVANLAGAIVSDERPEPAGAISAVLGSLNTARFTIKGRAFVCQPDHRLGLAAACTRWSNCGVLEPGGRQPWVRSPLVSP